MSKIVKIIGIFMALGAALVIGLAVLTKVVITPERVREAVMKVTAEALNRQVIIGDIEVSITSGIVINGLTVKEREGQDPFVKADRVELRYQLAPLLSKKLVIDEVRLDKPQLRVLRLADGSFNFSDLLPQEKTPAAAKPLSRNSERADSDINLLVSKLLVQGAALTFIDQAVEPGKSFRQELTLDLTVSDISLDHPFPLSLKGVVAGAPFAVEAEVRADGAFSRVSLTVDGLQLATFSPYYQKTLPGKLNAAKLSTAIELSTVGPRYQVKGSLSVRELDLALDALSKTPISGLSLALDHELLVDPGAGLLEISQATLHVGEGLAMGIDGRVTDFKNKPSLDLTLQFKEQDVAAALAALPPKLVEAATHYAPRGKLALRLHLAGLPGDGAKLLKGGEARLIGIKVSHHGKEPEINGTITIADSRLTTRDLRITLAENSADLTLSVADIWQTPYRMELTLTSDRFQLEPLLAPGAEAGGQSATEPPGAPAAKPTEEAAPIKLPVTATGKIDIAHAQYKDLAIDTFALGFTLEQNVLTVTRMTGAIGGGTFANTARVDLGKKGYTYKVAIGVKGIKAEEILPPFFPKTKGAVSGAMDLTADLAGAGTLPANAKQALTGKGELLLSDGELTGTTMAQGLATFLGIQELRILRFTRFLTRFDVAAGVAHINSEASGSDIRLSPSGTVGLVDEAVDLSLNTKLSPALSAKLDTRGEFSKLLREDDGWTLLPLKVGGSLGAPRFTLDSTLLMKKAAGALQNRLLEKLIPTPESPPSDGQQPVQPSPGKALENTLRGLFGR